MISRRSRLIGAASGGARGAGLGALPRTLLTGSSTWLSSEPLPSRGKETFWAMNNLRRNET
jgi:hypothetical protein